MVTCLGQSFTNTWGQMLAARFLLGRFHTVKSFRVLNFVGLGMGPKSATAPIWAAESVPARIRGRLVMMWQMYGIYLSVR